MNRIFTTAALSVAMFLVGSSANAGTILLSGWTIDIDAALGVAPGTYGTTGPINRLDFSGIAHTHLGDTNLNGLPDVGERFGIDGVVAATSFSPVSSNQTSVAGTFLNDAFEITGDFSTAAVVTSFDGANASFTHLAPGSIVDGVAYDGLLRLFADNVVNADTDLVTGLAPGSGFTDGQQVATFRTLSGTGNINVASFDGNDDLFFELVGAKAGVLFDSNGTDLSTLIGSSLVTIAFTDSNFDLNPSGGNPLGEDASASWNAPKAGVDLLTGIALSGFVETGFGSIGSAFAEENGSLRLQQVPEPSTFAIWATLMVGGVGLARRKMKNRS